MSLSLRGFILIYKVTELNLKIVMRAFPKNIVVFKFLKMEVHNEIRNWK